MRELKNKKGISLIVLVITIIVMIILATAIILSLNSSNIVEKAKEAKTASDLANAKNVVILAKGEWELMTSAERASNGGTFSVYAESKLQEAGYVTDATEGALDIGNDGTLYKYPKIPKGFIASDILTEDEVSEGLVIYEGTENVSTDIDAQTTRNQYVWVPVPEISSFIRRDGYYIGTLQTYVADGKVTEPYSFDTKITETNDLTGEYAEYAKMKASVEKYGGFYIARYEAGTSVERTAKSNGTSSDVLSQKDKYAYNYVGWGPNTTTISGKDITWNGYNQGKGAVELSRNIYPESANKEVVSTLIYGVQWDAVMHFMKDVENPNVAGKKYIQDSTGMSWNSDNYTTGNPKYKTGIDLDENASNMVKNIYDMAGNLFDWTMEAASTYATGLRVIRGGNFERSR